jgi:hypothetical protein
MSVAEIRHRAKELHFRLRNPPNAVPDRDIQMRRGAPVEVLRPFARSPLHEVEFHKRCLEFFNKCVEARPPRLTSKNFVANEIIRLVSQRYLVSPRLLLSDHKTTDLVVPRWVAMWLMREVTVQSQTWIAKRLNRDHTTVLHGIRKIEKRRREDPELQADLDQFLSALRPTTEKSNAEHITSRRP